MFASVCGTDTLERIFHLFFVARKVSDNPLPGILTPALLFSLTILYQLLHCNIVAVIAQCCTSVCFELYLKSGLQLYCRSVFFSCFQLFIQSFSYKKIYSPLFLSHFLNSLFRGVHIEFSCISPGATYPKVGIISVLGFMITVRNPLSTNLCKTNLAYCKGYS